MAGRGCFKAIAEADLDRWLAATPVDRARWDAMAEVPFVFHQSVDKAWGDIHRCLSDGTLDGTGEGPLCDVAVGEELICETDSEDYIHLKRPSKAAAIAAALRPVTQAWLRTRHRQLTNRDSTFAYVWQWFKKMRAFYRRAAKAGLAVVFCWG
jgi:hypothetical protein